MLLPYKSVSVAVTVKVKVEVVVVNVTVSAPQLVNSSRILAIFPRSGKPWQTSSAETASIVLTLPLRCWKYPDKIEIADTTALIMDLP